MPKGHQQQLLQLSTMITYKLRAGKCHKAISNSFCTYQPWSLTNWGQVNVTRPSATTLASMNQDHLHTEGRQMWQDHQQLLLHLWIRITYILRARICQKAINNSSASINWVHLLPEGKQMPQGHQQHLFCLSTRTTYSLRAGKCHKAISNSSGIYQMGSLTLWGQVNATRPSATALAAINHDHLQTEGRQMPQGHQQ